MDLNSAARSSGSFANPSSAARALTAAFVLLLAFARFVHADLLWTEEAYPMAAAAEVLRGKVLYRDIWFDKPPFYALIYLLWGNGLGWPLRLGGAAFVCASCFIAWLGLRGYAGLLAAALLAVHLTFYIPSAVIALAPDLLTVPFHIGAICLAMRRRAFLSGLCAGVAMLFNGKALFIALACFVWVPHLAFLGGFVLPCAPLLAVPDISGAFWRQVWVWGERYSADTFVLNPIREGLVRTANWLGFHAALAAGAAVFFRRNFSWRYAAWLGLSLLAVCAGLRFFPRYYFHLLPVFLIAGAQGLMLLRPKARFAVLCLLLIPAVRFAPRYFMLASGDRNWSDLALMNDSRAAAAIVKEIARPGDRLLVWGYRPEVFVFSGLPAATPFLDSQPLTGVLADRHLTSSKPSGSGLVEGNLAVAAGQNPAIIVDGLGPLNPELAVTQYPELLRDRYEIAGRTKFSTVYVTKR